MFHSPVTKPVQASHREQPCLALPNPVVGNQAQPGEEVDVLVDGELGRASGSINGGASAVGAGGIQSTIAATMIAVDRDADLAVEAPLP